MSPSSATCTRARLSLVAAEHRRYQPTNQPTNQQRPTDRPITDAVAARGTPGTPSPNTTTTTTKHPTLYTFQTPFPFARQNTRYYHRDLHYRHGSRWPRGWHVRTPVACFSSFIAVETPHTQLLAIASTGTRAMLSSESGTSEGTRLSDVHFRGQSIRQVRCYTFLSGCQLPWPPSCCPDRPTPFRFPMCRSVGASAGTRWYITR